MPCCSRLINARLTTTFLFAFEEPKGPETLFADADEFLLAMISLAALDVKIKSSMNFYSLAIGLKALLAATSSLLAKPCRTFSKSIADPDANR